MLIPDFLSHVSQATVVTSLEIKSLAASDLVQCPFSRSSQSDACEMLTSRAQEQRPCSPAIVAVQLIFGGMVPLMLEAAYSHHD